LKTKSLYGNFVKVSAALRIRQDLSVCWADHSLTSRTKF